jgi:hypothetical protein
VAVALSPGDTGYTSVYARWVREGSPNGVFDEYGEFGGRLWRVRTNDAGEPTFLLRAVAGPTDPGYDKDPETWQWGQSGRGFLVEMWESGGMKIREGPHENELIIETEALPYDESAWDPESDYD